MPIDRVIIKNYRAPRSTDISLNPELNVIVGDNESGKSTLLEAVCVALKCQLNRRPAAYELHPFLFSAEAISEIIASHQAGTPQTPLEIPIQLYFVNTAYASTCKQRSGGGFGRRAIVGLRKLSLTYDSAVDCAT